MPAYIIYIRNKTHDPDALAAYYDLVKTAPSAKHGLEMIATRDSPFEVLEGDPEAEFAVMLRFPSIEDARAWYNSGQYQEAIPHRQKGSDSRVFIVEAKG